MQPPCPLCLCGESRGSAVSYRLIPITLPDPVHDPGHHVLFFSTGAGRWKQGKLGRRRTEVTKPDPDEPHPGPPLAGLEKESLKHGV